MWYCGGYILQIYSKIKMLEKPKSLFSFKLITTLGKFLLYTFPVAKLLLTEVF